MLRLRKSEAPLDCGAFLLAGVNADRAFSISRDADSLRLLGVVICYFDAHDLLVLVAVLAVLACVSAFVEHNSD